MIIEPSSGSGRGKAARDDQAPAGPSDRLPTKVARPPASDAPPSTAAVMLVESERRPIWAFPIGERAITKKSGHCREELGSGAPHPNPVGPGPPPRLAVARRIQPPEPQTRAGTGMQPHVDEGGPDTDHDESDRNRPPLAVTPHQAPADPALPWCGAASARSRRGCSEWRACAMIEGILTPRMRPPLHQPQPHAGPESAADPAEDLAAVASLGDDQERAATTTRS